MTEFTATAQDTATKAKPYVCTTCTRPFARLEHLKRHERSHTKEKPFCCEQAGAIPGCGRRFARRDLLLRHQQKIHLFPNTSKRRRLSSVSTASGHSAQKKSADMREQFVISIPNLDDLTNFENGTVNPSSIYSNSPPTTTQSSLPQQQSFSMPRAETAQFGAGSNPGFSYATEKLFPQEQEISTPEGMNAQAWPMPELSIGIASPTSTVSSQYSPTTTYGSLGRTSSLELAGADSDLFSPDFFVGGAFQTMPQQQQQQHYPSTPNKSMSARRAHPHHLPPSPDASQLFLNTQLEQMAYLSSGRSHQIKSAGYVPEDAFAFQYAGGEQAYCNGFRPMDHPVYPALYPHHQYVESF